MCTKKPQHWKIESIVAFGRKSERKINTACKSRGMLKWKADEKWKINK